VLTRVDGDSRGGAALSRGHRQTDKPRTGEYMDALEDFHRPARHRIGMGDIVSLVERPRQSTASRRCAPPSGCAEGQFTADTRAARRHGKDGRHEWPDGDDARRRQIKSQMAERNLDDGVLKRQMAIID
jgi:signal recognition particle subunit SRP54